jgi:sec-independent protein translocase protein TatA
MEDKWLLVLLVIAVVFGASRLPSLGRNLGQGISEFRKGFAEATGDQADDAGPTTGSDVNPAVGNDATPPA